MPRGTTWSDTENAILRDLYPTANHDTLLAALPGRNMQTIRAQASKLGVGKTQRAINQPRTRVVLGQTLPFDWTPAENATLRDCYPTADHRELLEALPGRAMPSIRMQAHKLGLSKIRRTNSAVLTTTILGHLNTMELCYLAGIFDGEGCISLTRRRKEAHHHAVYALRLLITNTSLPLIDWLGAKLPGAISVKRQDDPRWQDCFTWTLTGNEQCRQFLRELSPYLIVKRAQAEAVADGWVHLNDAERDALFNRVRDLKRGG